MKLNKGNKRGISLIVLVITIIVMIILAAAIILSLNSSGIIGKANQAKADSDNANLLQAANVAAAEWNLKHKLGETTDDAKTYITNSLESQNFTEEQIAKLGITETGEVKIVNYTMYSDGTDEAPIPEGFSVSSVSTERTIENGLVIKDEAGNEFVWVPVDDITKFARTTTYTGTITAPDSSYTEPSLYNGSTEYQYATEVVEYNAMYNSIKEHKGFYIGRYEAGTTTERTVKDNGTTGLIVQKDKPVYNWVCWGPSMTSITGDVTDLDFGCNQGKGAVQLSQEMYKDSKSVVSTLCYGVQWDAALQFISTRGIKDTAYATNSTDKGNYIGSLEETGYYARNNIYDMAGNVYEWTMEASASYNRGLRGGSYGFVDGGIGLPASIRYGGTPDLAYDYIGFRPALYVK